MSDGGGIHFTSALALTAAPISLAANASPYITDVVGLMGICWYVYLGAREIRRWQKKRWPSNRN